MLISRVLGPGLGRGSEGSGHAAGREGEVADVVSDIWFMKARQVVQVQRVERVLVAHTLFGPESGQGGVGAGSRLGARTTPSHRST